MNIETLTNSVGLIVGAVVVVISFLTYTRRGKVRLGSFSVEFDKGEIEAHIGQARERLSQEEPEATPADRQYRLLAEYHGQGIAQSKISFWFSMVFASLGFAVILIGVLTIDRDLKLTAQAGPFLSLVAGTIIDAVSALFFVQSNKARRLMTEFLDRLRTDRKLEESLRQVSDIPDEVMKSRARVLLALHFADVKSPDGILDTIIRSPTPTQPRGPGST